MNWEEIFMPTVPIAEIFVRGTVIFFVIYALMHITGKRESGGHSLSDLLVVVLVAEAAAPGIYGDASGGGRQRHFNRNDSLLERRHRCDLLPCPCSTQTAQVEPLLAHH